MNDSRKTFAYPGIALVLLIAGAATLGRFGGLTLGQSVGALAVAIAMVAAAGSLIAMAQRRREKGIRNLLATRHCPTCGRQYDLSDVSPPKAVVWSAFDDPNVGRLVTCPRCAARVLWTDTGRLGRVSHPE